MNVRTPVVLIMLASAAAAGELPITVDPRMELLAAVQALTNYPVLSPLDSAYRKAMLEHFGPYKDHAAVKGFAAMWPRGYNYDGPVSTMICLSNPPELKLEAPAAECGAGRAGGEAKMRAWVDELRDFAKRSGFGAFFDAQQGAYRTMIERTRAKITGDYTAALYRYIGTQGHEPAFILAPMFRGNYGMRRRRPDGTLALYNVMGPERLVEGLPDFASSEGLRYLAWHEFGHSFVNPIVDAYEKELGRYAALMSPIEAKMRARAYGNWQTAVREHTLRAVNIRMAYLEQGREAGDAALRRERSDGFAYVPALVKRLEEYEANRGKYPTLASFGRRLIDVYRELHESKPGPEFYATYEHTLSSALADAPLVFIVPSAESDPAAQKQIVEYVTKRREQFWRDSEILTDVQALKTDLAGKTPVVYGTLKGNLWLARHAASFPIRLEPGRVVADGEYTGERLRVIAAWPHPQNPHRGAVIYTAARAEDVVGAGGLSFKGNPGYLVQRGTELAGQGAWALKNGAYELR